VTDVRGPVALQPGQSATINYRTVNPGSAAANGPWRDRIYLDRGAAGLLELASVLRTDSVASGAFTDRVVTVLLPDTVPDGEYRWVVRVDADNSLYERTGESNNQAQALDAVRVSRPDLQIRTVRAPSLLLSGAEMTVEWDVLNTGADAAGSWTDRIYLEQDGVRQELAAVRHEALAAGAGYTGSVTVRLPLSLQGEYELWIETDAGLEVRDAERSDNRQHQALSVQLAPYADLSVSSTTADTQVVGDPASLSVSWTVSNTGTGTGEQSEWTDKVILSTDGVLGNADDRVIGEYLHSGLLAAGDSYTQNQTIRLPIGMSGRYKLFVLSDAGAKVFENGLEANNRGDAGHDVDVMLKPYADLQVLSVEMTGQANSGRTLPVSWTVANLGIGITDLSDWTDTVWLSRNADGTGKIAELGSVRHIGALQAGDDYTHQLEVLIPEGLEGAYYLNVRTGAPYEFIFGGNNTATISLPVTLSPTPDLVVESISAPATAREGQSLDISWTVLNQGVADASGSWTDQVWLQPLDPAAQAVLLGSFRTDAVLESGVRYTRTEQIRLPAKLEGAWRLQVVTNAIRPGGANAVGIYEHGAAAGNNTASDDQAMTIALNPRPDLQVASVEVADDITAGASTALRFTIANQGPVAATGQWKDRVYLSLDGTWSADDELLGQYSNVSALAPTERYSNTTALIDIPVRYRGDAYLIVVTDSNNVVDEYPNEGNNIRAAKITIAPVAFADLVTGQVTAPDQAVHGSTVNVGYTVTNRGAGPTRGESATLNQWTDTVWLARDPRRPGASRGDILLSVVNHQGHLPSGGDYQGNVQVVIPDDIVSGQYFLTVWSDTYDVILEETLASELNPDDPGQQDNNNYKARPITILGIAPPDLVVEQVTAPAAASTGEAYAFSYTVKNRGDEFNGVWIDRVYLTDDPDLSKAREVWRLGEFQQNQTLGNGAGYTVSSSVALPAGVSGRYLVVVTDFKADVADSLRSNNHKVTDTAVVSPEADLRVTSVVVDSAAFSGEETP